MTHRLQDLIARQVAFDIDGLDVPRIVKDQAEYEVVPFLEVAPGGAEIKYMIGIGLPSSAGDVHFPFQPLKDPHDRAEITRVTRSLFDHAQDAAATADLNFQPAVNGSGRTSAGLVIPS